MDKDMTVFLNKGLAYRTEIEAAPEAFCSVKSNKVSTLNYTYNATLDDRGIGIFSGNTMPIMPRMKFRQLLIISSVLF